VSDSCPVDAAQRRTSPEGGRSPCISPDGSPGKAAKALAASSATATILWAVDRTTVMMGADPAFALRVTALEARLRAPELVEHF
jgi:hypothetical protein